MSEMKNIDKLIIMNDLQQIALPSTTAVGTTVPSNEDFAKKRAQNLLNYAGSIQETPFVQTEEMQEILEGLLMPGSAMGAIKPKGIFSVLKNLLGRTKSKTKIPSTVKSIQSEWKNNFFINKQFNEVLARLSNPKHFKRVDKLLERTPSKKISDWMKLQESLDPGVPSYLKGTLPGQHSLFSTGEDLNALVKEIAKNRAARLALKKVTDKLTDTASSIKK